MRSLWILVGIAVVATLYFIVDPGHELVPKCPFYLLTHHYCPGCGSQRALHAVLHGQIGRAMSFNPMLVLSLMYFLVEGVIALINRKDSSVRPLYERKWTPWIVFVIVMAFWILRNIPAYPFYLLAPH